MVCLLLLCVEKPGKADVCIRHIEELVVHGHRHNLGYITKLNEVLQDMVTKDLLPPHLGKVLNKQLRRASRGACSVRRLSTPPPVPFRPTPAWVGRMPRKKRQALAFLAGVGLLEIGMTLKDWLEGEGNEGLNQIRRTERKLEEKLRALKEKVEKLGALQSAALAAQEIESLIILESEEWQDILTLERDLLGNALLNEGYATAIEIYRTLNLTRQKPVKTEEGLEKIGIDKRLRRTTVELRSHSVCNWAVLSVTSIAAIPTAVCFDFVGERTTEYGDNLTLVSSGAGNNCVVLGDKKTGIELEDGSKFIPTNAWLLEGESCNDAFHNNPQLDFQVLEGELYFGTSGHMELYRSASCNVSLDKTVENTTVIPRLNTGGCVITNNTGKRQQWVAKAVGVRAGADIDIDTVVEMDEDNWLYEGFKETMMENEEKQAEGDEEEDIDGEEWTLDLEDWVKLGSGTTVLIAIILLVLIVRFCRRRSSPQEEETYVAYELNHLGKDYGEDRLQKDLDAIEDLSNQMSGIVKTLEKMVGEDVHHGGNVRGQCDGT